MQTWSKRTNTVISDSAGAPGAGRVPHPAGSVTAGVPGPELTGEAVSATPGRAGAAQKPGGCRWGQGGAGPATGPLSWRVGSQIQTLSFKKNKIPLLDPRNSLFKWSASGAFLPSPAETSSRAPGQHVQPRLHHAPAATSSQAAEAPWTNRHFSSFFLILLMSVVSPEPPPTPRPALAERCRGTGGRAGGRGAVQGPAASA